MNTVVKFFVCLFIYLFSACMFYVFFLLLLPRYWRNKDIF